MANDGGPAFPQTAQVEFLRQNGMSLRDWFAGQALAGIIGPIATDPRLAERIEGREMARIAYQAADAMLAERSKPPGG